MGKGFPHETPNPSFVTATSAGPTAIAVAPGTILETAAGIKGGDVAKIIEFTCDILFGATGETLTFTCEKDGVQFGETYVPTFVGGPGTRSSHYHWVDTAPGKGAPVYRVRCVGSLGNESALVRRLTVHNL